MNRSEMRVGGRCRASTNAETIRTLRSVLVATGGAAKIEELYRLMSADEVARFLGLAESTVRDMTYRRQLPFVKVGTRGCTLPTRGPHRLARIPNARLAWAHTGTMKRRSAPKMPRKPGSSSSKLNPTQRRLLSEVRKLAVMGGVNYESVLDYEPRWRTAHLQAAKDHLIRSQIIVWYTLTDEFLNAALCRYFFGNKSFQTLWKTRRFQYFNWYFLEELSLLAKLRYVQATWQGLPPKLARTIQNLNTVRNGIAHAFFPENLKKSQPV